MIQRTTSAFVGCVTAQIRLHSTSQALDRNTVCNLSSHPTNHSGVSRRVFSVQIARVAAAVALSSTYFSDAAHAARPEGVNRPDLLPEEKTSVIDLERFLASGEVRRLKEKIADLENRTGFKVRILTQRYPQSPGLAIRDYWSVNDDTVVIVADYFGGSGQLLKFNVGANVDKLLPPRFWSILSATYGNKFFVERKSEAISIINAFECVRTCLLRNGCAAPPDLDPAF
ncbi:Thylakoid lumenal 15.0 kDa protein 2, chloroplastic [Gracilariopsis chorda]|uniref:Thylakoid lumenal 15.0 kDa protein 2, chloroplastic n=1 Tax=Gracilariopsis chorda TaxID=448386 RepID=A0A2V3IXD5_9FLOR|nr:Thylakoid lumenal 15.0 kDa protein 2, chloroplastic [Gracilariopsis chorda]|eukprot:PXF46802.1 Thylakoid lumenal 15.0 kDa protein 2, chloroplastic [Gracilariopsis chorda]